MPAQTQHEGAQWLTGRAAVTCHSRGHLITLAYTYWGDIRWGWFWGTGLYARDSLFDLGVLYGRRLIAGRHGALSAAAGTMLFLHG